MTVFHQISRPIDYLLRMPVHDCKAQPRTEGEWGRVMQCRRHNRSGSTQSTYRFKPKVQLGLVWFAPLRKAIESRAVGEVDHGHRKPSWECPSLMVEDRPRCWIALDWILLWVKAQVVRADWYGWWQLECKWLECNLCTDWCAALSPSIHYKMLLIQYCSSLSSPKEQSTRTPSIFN